MKSLAWIVATLVVLGAAGEILSRPHRVVHLVETSGSLRPLPHRSTGLHLAPFDHVEVVAKQAAWHIAGALVIRASGGDVSAQSGDGYVVLGPGRPNCAGDAAAWDCRIPMRVSSRQPARLQALNHPVTITSVETETARARPVPATTPGALLVLAIGLAALGLLFVKMRSRPGPRRTVLASVGAAWLLWAGGWSGVLLLVLILGGYVLVRGPAASRPVRTRLVLPLLAVLVVFGFFKLHLLALWQLFANPGATPLLLPLGFAFFIVRAADLVLRAGTGGLPPVSLANYLTYMLFPATLPAGPVQSLPEFEASANPTVTLGEWTSGVWRILGGVVKKLSADLIAAIVVVPRLDTVYVEGGSMAPAALWTLLIANMIYVYLDFSGYSDIAVGCGRQLGWDLPENFRAPLWTTSMRDFWARWHISLSKWVATWIHVAVAFPLRRSQQFVRQTVPVMLTLVTMGLWHELQVVWIFWGIHHAAGIMAGDALGRRAGRGNAWLGRMSVWAWVALSHCFTLVGNPALALALYRRAIFWWW